MNNGRQMLSNWPLFTYSYADSLSLRLSSYYRIEIKVREKSNFEQLPAIHPSIDPHRSMDGWIE